MSQPRNFIWFIFSCFKARIYFKRSFGSGPREAEARANSVYEPLDLKVST